MCPQATCLFSVRLILWSLPALEDYLLLSLFLLSSLSQGLSIEALVCLSFKKKEEEEKEKKEREKKKKKEKKGRWGEEGKKKNKEELITSENLL